MKRIAYVFVDDFGHPKDTILPLIPQIFDYDKWHVCVMDSIDSICLMPTAPDLIVPMKLPNSTMIEDKPNWYESSFFTYQWMRWVREDGCGLFVVHAGFPFIPKDHPVSQGLIGRFVMHPAICPLRFEPVAGCKHPILEGVEGFEVCADEHFKVEGLDEEKTTVLAYSYSESCGKQPTAWAHSLGHGRIATLLPGHATPENQTLLNANMIRMMRNAIAWCGRVDQE